MLSWPPVLPLMVSVTLFPTVCPCDDVVDEPVVEPWDADVEAEVVFVWDVPTEFVADVPSVTVAELPCVADDDWPTVVPWETLSETVSPSVVDAEIVSVLD